MDNGLYPEDDDYSMIPESIADQTNFIMNDENDDFLNQNGNNDESRLTERTTEVRHLEKID